LRLAPGRRVSFSSDEKIAFSGLLPRKTAPTYIAYSGGWRQGRNHAFVRSIRSHVVQLFLRIDPQFIPNLKAAYL